MRAIKAFVLIAIVALAADASAQSCASTQGQLEYCKALTNAVRFGFPRYTTVLLPACSTNNKGAVAYDTTTDTVKYCTGSAWTAVGTPFTGGTITSPILAPAADNCASVPYSFTGDTNTGLCTSAADTAWIYANGQQIMRFTDSNIYLPTYPLSMGATAYIGDASTGRGAIFFLFDGTTGHAYQRGGNSPATSPQQYHWTYSYTDASNYQGGVLKTSASGIEIAAETAGSGADNLSVTLTPAGTGNVLSGAAVSETIPQYGLGTQSTTGIGQGQVNYLSMLVNGTARWTVDSAGTLQPGGAVPQGDAQDIGYLSGSSSYPVRHLALSRSIQGSKTKALTDAAAAAAFVRIAVPQTVGSNYAGGDVVWTAFAADATPHTQSLSGRLTFTAINNAGTEVCAVDPTAAVTAPNANSSGTLQCTFSCASNAADTIDLMATCDTSLGTPTALSLLYRLDMPQPNTVTPQ